jgi:type IV secretion system protein VirB10
VLVRAAFLFTLAACALPAQNPAPAPAAAQPTPAESVAQRSWVVEPGTRILLNLLNSVSTRSAMPGDRVYLETAFPVLVGPRIVIPPGSYVTGTITQARRAGKVKGRAELFVRFDSLTLANGVTRDFRARTASLDGDQKGKLDRDEGKVKGDSDKTGDLEKVGTGAGYGAMIGGVANGIKGAGIGAAAGAAAGLVGVLVTRGPDAVLPRGSTMEMLLDRPLAFREDEVPAGTSSARPVYPASPQLDPNRSKKTGWPGIDRP